MSKNNVRLMGWITLIAFPLAAYVLLTLFGDPTVEVFNNKVALYMQLLIGSVSGVVMGFSAFFLTQTPILQPATKKYEKLIIDFNLSFEEMLFLSLCAGFGEEVFFRGVLQEFWGVWITAFIFVFIHGYLNPKNWRISIYGSVMLLFMVAIGYFKSYYGLWTCIAAHFWIDLVIFYCLRQKTKNIVD